MSQICISLSHVKLQKGFMDCALILGCWYLELWIFGFRSCCRMPFVIECIFLWVYFFSRSYTIQFTNLWLNTLLTSKPWCVFFFFLLLLDLSLDNDYLLFICFNLSAGAHLDHHWTSRKSRQARRKRMKKIIGIYLRETFPIKY